jgi:predicted nucleic acid-binding protein
MIFVDTGYLLALLSPRDELFERAQRWANSVHEPLMTTEYVLLELANALSAPIDRPKVSCRHGRNSLLKKLGIGRFDN